MSAAPSPAPAVKPADTPTEKPAEAPAADATADKNKSRLWAVNILSTQEKEKLDDVLSKMKGSPYTVYTYSADVKGKTWLRLRVGFFSSREEAEKVGRELAARYNLDAPWIVRPGPIEIDTYGRQQ